MRSPLLGIIAITLFLGLLFQGTHQDGRTRANLRRGFRDSNGVYRRATMTGIGKPSYTFTILIIAVTAAAVYLRALT